MVNLLMKVAAVGGFALAGIGYTILIRGRSDVRQSDYYRRALQTLRDHEGAASVLGTPVNDYPFSLSENENFCNGREAHFDVPVRGPTAAGHYYFWSRRDGDEWTVTRAELALVKDPTRRLVIVKDAAVGDEIVVKSK